jgi:hypothetical protein
MKNETQLMMTNMAEGRQTEKSRDCPPTGGMKNETQLIMMNIAEGR